jgi:nucleoside-diphosphate-sugar epimerase
VRRILVTGANGFVGSRVCARLSRAGQAVRAQVRGDSPVANGDDVRVTGDLSTLTHPDDWAALVDSVDAVVHLAALTHAGGLRDTASWPRYHAVNVGVTQALAKAAAAAGVDAFVQLSSIKVNGERSARTMNDWQRLSANDPPRPEDNYGRSKWQAEQALAAAAAGMRVTMLRPPLLYGPGVKANLLRLFDAVARCRPLPFASIDNRRSLLGVDNLADAIVHALDTAPPGVRVYTLADADLSTPDLVRAIAQALEVAPRLWPCPVDVLRLAGRLAGRGAAIGRLTDSLVVDRDQIADGLGWRPPQSAAEGLAATAAWYRTCRP